MPNQRTIAIEKCCFLLPATFSKPFTESDKRRIEWVSLLQIIPLANSTTVPSIIQAANIKYNIYNWAFLVKSSGPEISNAVREAAKGSVGPTKAHIKSLYRLIRFVVDTKNYGLVILLTFWLIKSRTYWIFYHDFRRFVVNC
jgi:hypothetical protein